MHLAHNASAAASIHYLTLNYRALARSHWEARLASLSDKYSCSVWGLRDNVSATIYKGPGLYTMVRGNSFNHSNHLAYLFDKLGFIYKLTNGLWLVKPWFGVHLSSTSTFGKLWRLPRAPYREGHSFFQKEHISCWSIPQGEAHHCSIATIQLQQLHLKHQAPQQTVWWSLAASRQVKSTMPI